ncbi:MAG: hypothetical protein JST82_15395 [Bacteroidetes bacterium]|nr:hypothetical protein [Bacteroidota bacterium]
MRSILPITIFLLFLCSCAEENKPYVLEGNKIDEQERKEIRELQKDIYAALQNKTPDVIKRMVWKRIKYDDLSSVDTIVKYINPNTDFKLAYPVGEFRIHNTVKYRTTFVSSYLGSNEFKYHINPFTEDMYVYLMAVPDSSNSNQVLLSSVFAKINNKWVTVYLEAGRYMLLDKIAPFLYEKSMLYRNAQRIYPAAYYARLAKATLRPSKFFRYNMDNEILTYSNVTLQLGDYNTRNARLIMQNNLIPETVTLVPHGAGRRIVPSVIYNTTYSSHDSSSVIKQNKLLQQEIDKKLFPDIFDLGDTLLYRISCSDDKVYEIKQASPHPIYH